VGDKAAKYIRLFNQANDLLSKDSSLIAQMATINALLYHKMKDFFWVGFYFKNDNFLTVGPYQGPLACQNLSYPNGVCWTSILKAEPILVPDVSKFPGHIACDSRSKSEMVVPLINSNNKPVAVLDIDSEKLNQFDENDLIGITRILSLIKIEYIDSADKLFYSK
jgi:L-methionine (R)-S-oxide reductase